MRADDPDVIRCELNTDPRRTAHEHHVPVVLRVDCAAQHSRPERALLREVSSVEHHDLILDLHADHRDIEQAPV